MYKEYDAITVTVNGPNASGKSTVALILAKVLKALNLSFAMSDETVLSAMVSSLDTGEDELAKRVKLPIVIQGESKYGGRNILNSGIDPEKLHLMLRDIQQKKDYETHEAFPVSQEPKYGIKNNRIYNRASGEYIPRDEPVMIFRARDSKAIKVLQWYMSLFRSTTDHYRAIRQRVQDFLTFSVNHPDRMKYPDTDRMTFNQDVSTPITSEEIQDIVFSQATDLMNLAHRHGIVIKMNIPTTMDQETYGSRSSLVVTADKGGRVMLSPTPETTSAQYIG